MVKLAASAAFKTAPPDRLSLSISRLFSSPNESPVPKLLNKSIDTAVNTNNIYSLPNYISAKLSEN